MKMLAEGARAVMIRGAAEGLFPEDPEEAFDLVEPRRAGRCVVKVDLRMLRDGGCLRHA
ncbi:MAG TPA: hypothetical protein VMK12_29260 [Anaeromyxobacteraceae bacterium]|nr:hypothetical protein [Anaeromyxobacteraceae bacterium]